ncbi:hypothetical protein BN59_03683 [Legionella massiliensis]|uniref:Uncharacterized protein n=1 Tax=Legionella massiliensis TaxID=1034943 RepID=A0A078KY93_9GAMM|nr:hypothetical protein [Legionella massiliensis]CDZ79365.1 hypothetical protein BN59_03683 [Legionella massiliensis]CEE15103.1 hypothetical protein BN1094_03683 [Legionella massiliensis]
MNKQSKSELTRQRIIQAIVRIQYNRPKVIAKDRKLSISSVAQEAEISRASLHNNYPDIIKRIQEIKSAISPTPIDKKDSSLKKLQRINKELRLEIQHLNSELSKITSINATILMENARLHSIVDSNNIVLLGKDN